MQLIKKSEQFDKQNGREEEKMEEDLDFFLNNNAIKKRKKNDEEKKVRRRKLKPHTTTRIRSWNFISNISYNGVKEEDL